MVIRQCLICGVSIESKREGTRFCSAACYQRMRRSLATLNAPPEKTRHSALNAIDQCRHFYKAKAIKGQYKCVEFGGVTCEKREAACAFLVPNMRLINIANEKIRRKHGN